MKAPRGLDVLLTGGDRLPGLLPPLLLSRLCRLARPRDGGHHLFLRVATDLAHHLRAAGQADDQLRELDGRHLRQVSYLIFAAEVCDSKRTMPDEQAGGPAHHSCRVER